MSTTRFLDEVLPRYKQILTDVGNPDKLAELRTDLQMRSAMGVDVVSATNAVDSFSKQSAYDAATALARQVEVLLLNRDAYQQAGDDEKNTALKHHTQQRALYLNLLQQSRSIRGSTISGVDAPYLDGSNMVRYDGDQDQAAARGVDQEGVNIKQTGRGIK